MKKKEIALFVMFVFFFFLTACKSINKNDLITPSYSVILSFDDGPNSHLDTTEKLLDVLKKYNIKAMFALLGVNVLNNTDIVKRIYEEGHIIINHGYSDKWASKMNDDEFLNNLIMGEDAIKTALGNDLKPLLYRPQGGFYKSSQEEILKEKGYKIINANIRVYDAVKVKKNQKKIINLIIKKAENLGGGIILLHDARDSFIKMENEIEKNPNSSYNRSWIPEAVEIIIIKLLEKGFVFENPNLII